MNDHRNPQLQDVLSFGPFSLFAAERLLKKADKPIPLGGRALDILIALAERAGEVVTHKELISTAWPDVTVEEANLRFQMAALRKALGDGQDGARSVRAGKQRGRYGSSESPHPLEYGRLRRQAVGMRPKGLSHNSLGGPPWGKCWTRSPSESRSESQARRLIRPPCENSEKLHNSGSCNHFTALQLPEACRGARAPTLQPNGAFETECGYDTS
jgi:hypothetical protein